VGKIDVIVADLHNPQAPQHIYDYCRNKGYKINLLVNNAGYAIAGSFDQTSMEGRGKVYPRFRDCRNCLEQVVYKRYAWKQQMEKS
jgi:NAD(P)-dependent dehydrogenase (short-subunit alcohol dehydrogenase family)